MPLDASRHPPLFALVDVNNFYVSCERAFNPRLAHVPVVVLSNHDGCAVARSNEVKALGVKMGAPWFEIRHLEEQEGLVALSANFALYGDMSDRMMSLAAGLGHRQEIIVELVQRVLCCQIQKTLNVWINACF